ncbi:MAG: hypothetical protein AAGC92_08600 [Pseudomonadota bacterium]
MSWTTQPRKLADFGKLLPAEKKLLAELDTGQPCIIGREVPPENPPEDIVIRASFLRWCILRGPEEETPKTRMHEKGLRVQGAFIQGDGPTPYNAEHTTGLDLQGCTIRGDLILAFCRFPDMVLLRGASLTTLNLHGSHLMAGLAADGMQTTGAVFLRQVQVTGETRLLGARIGGDLACDGGRFENPVNDEKGQPNDALAINRAEVLGGFFWREGTRIEGAMDLRAAKLGVINDDPDCWPKKEGELLLDRCTYDAFLGRSPVDARQRLKWLALQDPTRWGADFWPQPYEQLAKVLRETGHEADARRVMIEKERLQRAAARRRAYKSNPNFGGVVRFLLFVRDWLLGTTVRYGRQPFLAFAWLLGFWLLGLIVFQTAQNQGALKPNNAFVLRAPEWVGCAGTQAYPTQYDCFRAQPQAVSYPRFNAAIYSLDTLLPIVALEMQEFWIPDEDHPFGYWARIYLWVQIGLGWALSLLAVAGFSGLIRSDSGT